ncbi:MAG: PAS domain S-box protein [Marinobacter sp.]|uniref:PAS domain S-box protein n=1 Tax=Marinobacter sp. TaxID=50741 RepID=UPI003F9A2430
MLLHKAATKDAVHQLFDAVNAISVQGYDEDRRVTYWNMGSELLYGYTKEEALGKKIEELIIPEHMRDVVISAHREWISNGIEIPASEITLRNKIGKDVNVFSNHVLFTDEQNKQEMYCIDINLSEVRKAQEQAVFKDNMLKAVFEATPDLFFLMEEDGTIIDYHSSDEEDLYVSPNVFVGKTIGSFLPENLSVKFKDYINDVTFKDDVLSFEYYLCMPHGKCYFEARLSHLKAYKQIVTIIRDITEQHKSSEIIRQHAYFDALTLLPNRFLSLDRLSQILKEAERSSEKLPRICLIYLESRSKLMAGS